MARTFGELPTEILDAVFLYLDPPSLLAVSQTCKHINKISTEAPLIWRHFCRTHFKSWSPHHNIAAKFAGPLKDVDWRALFIRRINAERETLQLLDRALETQHERIKNLNEIADFGYDVKEVLLKEVACAEQKEDVLARRYYSGAVLQRIQREMAINVWKDLFDGVDVPMERGLGAYDMFARTGEFVDFDKISEDLDRLANGVLNLHPDFHDMSARMKASTLALSLRDQGFKGVSDASYRALRNSFIGIVLRSSSHESLPLISVAIYCAIAKRLGLDARPCGFLFHVYCLVYAPKDYTLDGTYKPTNSPDRDSMYLDPFRSSDEVRQTDLQRVLREMGVPTTDHQAFLTDTNTRELILRTARNIMNSVQTIRQTEASAHGINSSWMNAYPDMDNAFYATIWAMLILGPREDQPTTFSNPTTRRRQYLPYLLEHFQTHCPWDIPLIEKYVVPMFSNQPEGGRLLFFVDRFHRKDAEPREKRYRDERAQHVKFKVGEVFKHKRYQYEGVITGWDTECSAQEDWILNMGVDRLPNGRHQSFYNVLICDKSVRYVAEENILPLRPDDGPSPALMYIAGRHFKRWDNEKRVFVSNVRDEFPED